MSYKLCINIVLSSDPEIIYLLSDDITTDNTQSSWASLNIYTYLVSYKFHILIVVFDADTIYLLSDVILT